MNSDFTNASELDWRLIKAFVAVMQERTLSAAARKLGTTQPTIGRQIRELEETCGELLFFRRGKSLDPTPAALGLSARAEDVEASVVSLSRAFARIGESDSLRIVRITAPTLIADHLLPNTLPSASKALPKAEFHILPSDSVQDLQRRHADIALRLTEPTQPDLITQRIGEVQIGLHATQDYLSKMGHPTKIADLARHRLILPSNETQISAAAANVGLEPGVLTASIRSDDLRHRHALMKAGAGIATGHSWMTQFDPDLRQVLPNVIIDTLPVWLVATEDIRTSRTLRCAYDILRNFARRAFARSS